MTQQIIQNAGDTRKYFHILPHLADDDLNPYQYRLYGHYVRVCGVSGYCDESVRTTARKTQMSVGKVVQARTELAALGFILCTFGAGQNDTVRITLLDRWAENVARYSEKRSPHEHPVHTMNTGVHTMNTSEVEGCSPGEPKKNTIKNQSKKNHYYKKPAAEEAQQDDMNRGGDSTPQTAIPELPASKPEVRAEEKSSAKKEEVIPDDGLATVARAYEENIGLLTPMLRDKLLDALEDYPAGWIVDAIGIAVGAEKRFWSYVEGILKRWKRDGKDTPAQTGAAPTSAAEPVSMPPGYVLPTEDEYERNLQEG